MNKLYFLTTEDIEELIHEVLHSIGSAMTSHDGPSNAELQNEIEHIICNYFNITREKTNIATSTQSQLLTTEMQRMQILNDLELSSSSENKVTLDFNTAFNLTIDANTAFKLETENRELQARVSALATIAEVMMKEAGDA
jgi:septum formation topological specificity factor MinE